MESQAAKEKRKKHEVVVALLNVPLNVFQLMVNRWVKLKIPPFNIELEILFCFFFRLCFCFSFLSFLNRLYRIMTSLRCHELFVVERLPRAEKNSTKILAFSSWPMCYSNFSHEF